LNCKSIQMEKVKNRVFIGFLGLAILLCGCVEFKQLKLYDGMESAPKLGKPESISKVLEKVVYYDDHSDVWGVENEICKEAEYISDVVYSGTEAIKISWNRGDEGCIFAGFGIGWDGWAGKDLTQVMDYAAFRFYVRAQKERMYGLPIVLTLEDYSGGMGFCYTANKYFERTFIDTTWQRIEVPLSDFDLDTESLDITNVKQLQLELQQNGSIYIDDISLVFHTPPVVEPWMQEEVLPDPLEMPITIFDDAFINNHGWGMMNGNCRNVEISSSEAYSGGEAISAKWNNTGECNVMDIGASWNKWHPVNFTKGNIDDFAFEFYIYNRGELTPELNLYFGLRDYNGNVVRTQISATYANEDVFNSSWTRVSVPIAELKGSAINFSNIKELVFQMEGTGDVLIDEVKMVRRKVN
jgi:hypothetical protein